MTYYGHLFSNREKKTCVFCRDKRRCKLNVIVRSKKIIIWNVLLKKNGFINL